MKKIINGRRYDTDTARLVSSAGYSYPGDFEYWLEKLSRGKWTDEQNGMRYRRVPRRWRIGKIKPLRTKRALIRTDNYGKYYGKRFIVDNIEVDDNNKQ